MSVLDRTELEQSPLADLHAIASELRIEGFRRLRRDELIAAVLGAQGAVPEDEDGAVAPRRTRAPRRRGRRSAGAAAAEEAERALEERPAPAPDEDEPAERAAEEEIRSGIVELSANGGGFLRVAGLEPSSEDPYLSPAQVRRAGLRAGDEVSGRVRPRRRSERHPSLVRIESVNGAAAEQRPARLRFEELTPVWPTQRLEAPRAIVDVPYGKGSRVAIGGQPGAGATTLLREMVSTLRERHPDLDVAVLLIGARPEEVTDWRLAQLAPVEGGAFDRPLPELTRAADLVTERAKRAVESGRDVVVVIDSLEALPLESARAVFGAGRATEEGGSLTTLAATGEAVHLRRLASTRVMLDAGISGRFPGSVVAAASGATRAELLS